MILGLTFAILFHSILYFSIYYRLIKSPIPIQIDTRLINIIPLLFIFLTPLLSGNIFENSTITNAPELVPEVADHSLLYLMAYIVAVLLFITVAYFYNAKLIIGLSKGRLERAIKYSLERLEVDFQHHQNDYLIPKLHLSLRIETGYTFRVCKLRLRNSNNRHFLLKLGRYIEQYTHARKILAPTITINHYRNIAIMELNVVMLSIIYQLT